MGKATLKHGPNHHLFEETFDDDAVFLELTNCEFTATEKIVTVRIPLAIWEHVRTASPARFDLVSLSDEELEHFVRAQWMARQKHLENAQTISAVAMLGALVWGTGTPDEQLAHGLSEYRKLRGQQRDLRNEIDALDAAK